MDAGLSLSLDVGLPTGPGVLTSPSMLVMLELATGPGVLVMLELATGPGVLVTGELLTSPDMLMTLELPTSPDMLMTLELPTSPDMLMTLELATSPDMLMTLELATGPGVPASVALAAASALLVARPARPLRRRAGMLVSARDHAGAEAGLALRAHFRACGLARRGTSLFAQRGLEGGADLDMRLGSVGALLILLRRDLDARGG